jgi:hypothetical protein
MNSMRRLLLGALAVLASPFKAQAQSGTKAPDQMGRELRAMFLSTKAESLGIKPNTEYPRVIGVAMDWSIGEHIATLVSLSDGTASLYTTSTFGIIGGAGHTSVRTAAQRFVKASDRYLSDTTATTSHPYPRKDKIRFYLITFGGLRTVETEAASVYSGSGKFSQLFGEGQAVLTELRKVTEKGS